MLIPFVRILSASREMFPQRSWCGVLRIREGEMRALNHNVFGQFNPCCSLLGRTSSGCLGDWSGRPGDRLPDRFYRSNRAWNWYFVQELWITYDSLGLEDKIAYSWCRVSKMERLLTDSSIPVLFKERWRDMWGDSDWVWTVSLMYASSKEEKI